VVAQSLVGPEHNFLVTGHTLFLNLHFEVNL
jgi:hypothetical protein